MVPDYFFLALFNYYRQWHDDRSTITHLSTRTFEKCKWYTSIFDTWELPRSLSESGFTIDLTELIIIHSLLSAPLRSNGADYVLLLFIFLFFLILLFFYSPFVLRNYSTDSHQISGIVYSGVV